MAHSSFTHSSTLPRCLEIPELHSPAERKLTAQSKHNYPPNLRYRLIAPSSCPTSCVCLSAFVTRTWSCTMKVCTSRGISSFRIAFFSFSFRPITRHAKRKNVAITSHPSLFATLEAMRAVEPIRHPPIHPAFINPPTHRVTSRQ